MTERSGCSIRLIEAANVAPGESEHILTDRRSIAIFNIEGTFHAIEGLCPHAGAPLADGYLEGTVVICPWHAWRFDLEDGRCPLVPGARLHVYRVHESNGWLWTELGPELARPT